MSGTAASSTSASRSAVIAAVAAGALAAICASGVTGLSDTDPYRHLAYARMLVESGFTLRGHPFLPQTLLGSSGVDLWWGFHLLMVPFSFLGILTGARVAGVAIAATQAGSMAWLATRLGQRQGWLFALLPSFTSAYFVARGFSARPGHLTIPLVAISLAAGAGELEPAWAGGAALAHGLLHLSSPLALVFTALGALGARLSRVRTGGRALLASAGGLVAAYLLRPDRAEYLSVALVHNLGALGHLGVGRLPGSGLELLPIDLSRFVDEVWREVVVVGAFAWLGRGRIRSGRPAAVGASALAALFSAALCFESGRFLDYLLPFLALSAALWAPALEELTPMLRAGLTAVGVALGAATPQHVERAWRLGNAFIAPPQSYDELAALIRSRVPPGTLLVSDDLLLTGVLLASVPEYRFLCAYDPVLLFAQTPRQYWRWLHLTSQGRDCPQRECPDGEGDATEVANAIRELGSDWFVSFSLREGYTVLKPLHENPERFELLGSTPGPAGRMSLWHVRSDAP